MTRTSFSLTLSLTRTVYPSMTDTITVESWTHSLPPFPTTLSLTRTSLPSLGHNDLLLEIYSASLNPVDVQLSNLSIFRIPSLGSNPRGLGKDFVGKLLAKGSNVKRDDLKIGDELFGVTMNPVEFFTFAFSSPHFSDEEEESSKNKTFRKTYMMSFCYIVRWSTLWNFIYYFNPRSLENSRDQETSFSLSLSSSFVTSKFLDC